MALTPEEKQILEYGKSNGKSPDEVKQAIAKYRQDIATQPTKQVQPETENKGFTDVAANALDAIFGGGKIGEAIGTEIAKGTFGDTIQRLVTGQDISPEAEATIKRDVTPAQIAGDVARVGATFVPISRASELATRGASALGAGAAAKTIGNVVAGGATGALADVGVSVSEGEAPRLGIGTLIGAGIPATSPLIGAMTRAAGKLGIRAGSEVSGALTGTSAETLEQAFDAAQAGGKQLDEFTKALRGQTTPEALVNNVRESIDQVAAQRNQLFRTTLEELGDTVVETAPAKTQFTQALSNAGVTVDENGVLNFANSKLRTVPNAQNKLNQAWQEINAMPETLSLAELDTTRQAVKAIQSISGDEPSANLANMLIDEGVRSVRTAGEQVDGYGQMLDEFGESSEFLNELQKGLSSGDRSTVDQAYRRMATALKTNNEQRAALVRELDQLTDGAILSQIAGQQLSEALPRGIFRQILAGTYGTAAIAGTITPALLPTLVFASPRVVGEIVRALGIGASKTTEVIEAVNKARDLLIKAGAISGAEVGG